MHTNTYFDDRQAGRANRPDQPEAPRSGVTIRLGREEPIVDEPVGVIVAGCEPRSTVVVQAAVDVLGAVHEARGTFEADAAGVVDTSVHASRAGTYTGVDPFGLWWSGEPAAASSAPPFGPVRSWLRADTTGGTAESVVERRWLAPGATLTEVREPGVYGLFARPVGSGPFPAVVAFGGSGGGLAGSAGWAAILASHGFATLALAYFGVPSLPQALVEIEVETVERAIAWLRGRPEVAADGVAVMGMSRGSELALLAGVLLEHVCAVVTFAPSGVVWAGLGPRGPVDAPAWTFRGEAIPYVSVGANPPDGVPAARPLALRPMFERAFQNGPAIHPAEIPIERCRGPILLVSGEADAMWPATPMSDAVQRRAATFGFAHSVTHLHYPDAGHTCAGVPGTPTATEARLALDGGLYALGGTRAANAWARADSWPRVLAFLAEALAERHDAH